MRSHAPHNPWPWIIAVIGLAFSTVTAWSIYRAGQGVSSVTDPRYYSHGLKYNSTSLETKAAQSLGWTITPAAASPPRGIAFSLRDGDGAPIRGADGQITLASEAAGTRQPVIPLRETTPGIYRADLPPGLPPTVNAAISIGRDGARIRRRLIISLP